VSARQRAGWTLIAVAGVISSAIVTLEVTALMDNQNPESSETLPVVGFEPPDE
jgi:heme/copper-type cytochrome/quinol oxidase subunit 2